MPGLRSGPGHRGAAFKRGKLAERAYAEQAAAGGADAQTEGGAQEEASAADDDVVDAEFEEVKDDNK